MAIISLKQKILVCGGGNGAHCLSALAASRGNFEVHVLTLYEDEAERWSKSVHDENMKLTLVNEDGSQGKIYSKPSVITKDPKVALSGVQIIFLVVPAFAHKQYLDAILPNLQNNTLIIGLPGQPGFEFQCRELLGHVASTCTIASSNTLPFSCRIAEYGRSIVMLGVKDVLAVSLIKGRKCELPFSAIDIIQEVLGEKPKVRKIQNYLALNLMAIPIVHPPMMYGKWRYWDGTPLKEEPLFYQGVSDIEADLISKTSDEKVKIAKKIEKMRNDIDMSEIIHVFDWFKSYYQNHISDKSSLRMAMRTNKAYNGVVHPMISTANGYVPNFEHRYLREDVPSGLVVLKGIAEIVEEETPVVDTVIEWAQKKLGKEYIVGSKLTGKDLKSSRAPQSYGISTLDELLAM